MTTVRLLNKDVTWGQKSKKEYVVDEKGEPVLTKNGNKKRRKIELTDWNNRKNAEKWRASFSSLCNRYLEENKVEKG